MSAITLNCTYHSREIGGVSWRLKALTAEINELPVDAIVFREDLYPRIEKSAATVQKYAEDLSVLPPIEINQRRELIDGWNRWTAHKEKQAATIRVIVTETKSDTELLELAIERNAKHGLQLSQADKQDMARRIYNSTPVKERDEKKEHLAAILSQDPKTISRWLEDIDKNARAARKRKIFDMWLECHKQEEIAVAVDRSPASISEAVDKFGIGQLSNSEEALASHAVEFEPMLYDVWRQQAKTPGSGSDHFGNSEVRWVDNLLYAYTQPFDVVVDPFAGGGSTIDICKKRFRRYWVSDRKPVPRREHEIRQHDITAGLPPLARWKDVKLVYLDPPYWKQAEGKYSNDPTDLANMPLEQFNQTLAGLINDFAKKLAPGAAIALIIQSTQWNAPERRRVDHVADMLKRVSLPIEERIQAPYESQQYTPQMVEWAKENRKRLVLSREIVVWGVA